jgi:hypothetical protein
VTTTLWRRLGIGAAASQALAMAVFAADVTWSTPGTGFWDDASNWPGGVLPTPVDDVTIDFGVPTAVIRQPAGGPASPLFQFAVASLLAKSPVEHAGGSLMVQGDATFEEAFTWSGGVLHVDSSVASGTWTFGKGMHLTAPGLVGMNNGAVELQGTSILEGGHGILFGLVPEHVAAGATVDVRAGSQFTVQDALVNDGTIDRTAGTGVYEIFFRGGSNQGVIRNRTGVLSYANSFDPVSHTGTFAVDAGAELRFVGAQTFLNTISGAGNVTFTQFHDYQVDAASFALDGTVRLENGAQVTWNGDGTLRNLHFSSGNLLPQGHVDIVEQSRVEGIGFVTGAPGSRTRFLGGLDLRSNFIVNGGNVELGGDTVLLGNVGLGVSAGATLTVLRGASLTLANDATPQGAGASLGGGRFVNQGLVRRDTATGEFQFGVNEFVNEGRFALASGQATALVDFQQTVGGILAIELGSVVGPFVVGGEASLAGLLEIAFANGFLPKLGETFEVMTFGTRTGAFALSTVGEAARTGYTYVLHYGSNTLNLEVTGLAPPVPEPATFLMLGVGLALLLVLRRPAMC